MVEPRNKSVVGGPTNAPVLTPPLDVDALAQFIRKVDGNHSLGAGALAEQICGWLAAGPRVEPQPCGCVDSCQQVVGKRCRWPAAPLRPDPTDEKRGRDRDGSTSDAAGVIVAWPRFWVGKYSSVVGLSVMVQRDPTKNSERFCSFAPTMPRVQQEAAASLIVAAMNGWMGGMK